jgi:aminopeptidase N
MVSVFLALTIAASSLAQPPSSPAQQTGEISRQSRHSCLAAKRDRLTRIRALDDGPPVPPTDYDALHYAINLDVDFDHEAIVGEVSITARSLTSDLGQLIVDLHDSMVVDEVTRAGISLTYQHADDRLTIDLDRTFQSGELLTVRISYGGNPIPGGFLGPGFGFYSHDSSPVACTFSQPWFAPTWWPCKETPADKATASIAITVPAELVAASNGTLVEVQDDGATKTWCWQTSYPIATYLVSVAIADYQHFSDVYEPEGGDTMPIDYFVYPEHYDEALAAWDVVVDQLEFFGSIFGEYPFMQEKYGMAEVPWDGAMEHQTLTSLGASCIESEMVIAHELAHQWWGDLVTCATWHDMWLNEGFATYAEALLWGEMHPDGGYQQYMQWIDWVEPGGFPGSVYVYDLDDPGNIFSLTVYHKGAWVLHMLRGVVGDDDFFAGIDAWRETHGYGSASTEDFEAVMESSTGISLDWFFDEWVYGEHRPEYEYSWLPDFPQPGQITLRVEQVQCDAPPFKMPIQIAVHTNLGAERFSAWDSLAVQSFVFDVAGTPLNVVFDPENWVLDWHRESEVGVTPSSRSQTGPSIGRIYPNPFQSSVAIPYRLAQPSNSAQNRATLAVYDLAGRLVRTVFDGRLPGEDRLVIWDGRLDSGQVAPSGIYFVRLETAAGVDTRKIVHTR